MIKNNLSEILTRLQDPNVRNEILNKNLIPLGENKRKTNLQPNSINLTSENIRNNKNLVTKNVLQKPPIIQEDRSFNLLELDELFENSKEVGKNPNEIQLKDERIQEENSSFQLDHNDISDLIREELEFERHNESFKRKNGNQNNYKAIQQGTNQNSSNNNLNKTNNNQNNYSSNNNFNSNYFSSENFFSKGSNFDREFAIQNNQENKFMGNFINERDVHSSNNFSEDICEDSSNNYNNVDFGDYEIDKIDKKIEEINENSGSVGDGYVQQGDFEKIENKNYKLADLSQWKSSRHEHEVESANRHLFGFQFFRPNQREIIYACLESRDTFVCMPTGGGKSLTFQIPGVIKDGACIVVMPLLSLIQDQVSILTGLGIKVLNLKGEGQIEAERNFYEYFLSKDEDTEKVKFIFITPEKFSKSPSTLKLLSNLNEYNLISRFVIDEAHCLSQWGREFRPDYMNLVHLRKRFPKVPISAITATATNKVRDDIINILGLKDCLFFRSSYNRHNLYLEVRDKKNVVNPITNIYEFIREHNYLDKTGIIYCSSKKECETVNKKLREIGLSSEFYHASMPEPKRISIQEKWKNDEVKIIVATIAFGMGINKNDVRYVIHYNMPKSFENYYQEIGRAGRDGNNSHCLLYYQMQDRKIMEFLLANQHLSLEMNKLNLRKINEVQEFCEELIECRRILALRYFGENFRRENCKKQCDNCKKSLTKEEIDLTDYAYKICEVVKFFQNSNEKVTFLSLTDFLRGTGAGKFKKKQSKISNSNYFGYLKDLSVDLVKRLIRRLIIEKFLYENLVTNNYGSNCYVYLDDQGVFFLRSRGNRKFILVVPLTKGSKLLLEDIEEEEKEEPEMQNLDEYKFKEEPKEKKVRRRYGKTIVDLDKPENDEKVTEFKEDYGFCSSKSKFDELLDILKRRRNEIYKLEKDKSDQPNKHISADAIFPTNGLMELCRKLPDKKSDLNSNYIFGVASDKLNSFGEHFLPDIQKFIKLNQIVKNEDLIQKYASEKKNKENNSGKKKSYITSSQFKESDNSQKKQIDFNEDEENLINQIRERYVSPSALDAKEKEVKEITSKINTNPIEKQVFPQEADNDYDEFNQFEQHKDVSDDEVQCFIPNEADFQNFANEAKLLNKENKKRKKEETDEEDPDVGGKKGKKGGGGKGDYFKNKFKWKKINENRRKKKDNKFI